MLARMLTHEELSELVADGTIDTVVCAFTDMQGRLVGKREEAHYFLAETDAQIVGDGDANHFRSYPES